MPKAPPKSSTPPTDEPSATASSSLPTDEPKASATSAAPPNLGLDPQPDSFKEPKIFDIWCKEIYRRTHHGDKSYEDIGRQAFVNSGRFRSPQDVPDCLVETMLRMTKT